MQERLQRIWEQIVDWWKKFNRKQQILIVSIVLAMVLAIVILAYVISRPTVIELATCEDTAQAAQVKELLTSNDIWYEVSNDGLRFSIHAQDEPNARILLGSNSIPTKGFTIDDALNGSFTTTEADKDRRYQLYLENKLEETLEFLNNVKSADVTLNLPTDDGTLIAKKEPGYARVVLALNGAMDEEQAAGLARLIATGLGNDNADNIFIMDSDNNVLYSGGDESSIIGTANSQLALRQKYEQSVKKSVKDVMIGTELYSNVEVGMNLDMSFDNRVITDHEFYVGEGMTQGYLDSESSYESTAVGGLAAPPGTDSNNDNSYVLENNEYTESSVTETKKDYLPSERLTKTTGGAGTINYDTSSVSVVATTYVMYNEDTLRESGQLEDMTFEEFKAANSARVKTEVDEDFYALVSNATGFPVDNISIVAYEVPFFQYSSKSGRTAADYFQIALAVLIFALLGYVVFRSTRRDQVQELEPELSVESLLASTREQASDLEDIAYSEKSEARLLIEKFVDEKPEAVASLLRNWLNEDWD
ncbi:MAG: flagellar basal-body MS-ring/collar protein FliF [bacterium]|nr:flagellar basal-body MS-ring/collar protein FliF [bacterium]